MNRKTKFWYGCCLVFALALARLAYGQPSNSIATSSNPALVNQPIVYTVQINAQNSINVLPTGSVTFTDGGQLLGTAQLQPDATASLTTQLSVPGDHSIVAAYSGDSNFGPSQTAPFLQHITAADAFTLSTTPTAISQAAGASTAISVTLFSPTNSTDTVHLSCDGLPPGVACTFHDSSLVPSPQGTPTTLTVQSTATQTTHTSLNSAVGSLACVLIVAFVFTFTFGGSQRTAHVFVGLALLLFLVACGSHTVFRNTATPAGTSTFRVIGSDPALTQASQVQLTVR